MERQGVLDNGGVERAVGSRNHRHGHRNRAVRTGGSRNGRLFHTRLRENTVVPGERDGGFADGGIEVNHNVNMEGENAVAARRIRQILGVGSGHRVEAVVIEHRQRVHVHGGVEGAVGGRNHGHVHHQQAVGTGGGCKDGH